MHRAPALIVAALLSATIPAPSAAGTSAVSSRIYWTDANWWNTAAAEVGRAHADGSGVQVVAPVADETPGVQQTGYLAIDPQQAHVYWAESYPISGIWRAHLDGTSPELVIYDEGAFGVAVSAGGIYWTDDMDGSIRRSALDGSGTRTLVRGQGVPGSHVASPHDLALDVSRGKMYWTATGLNAVRRANLDGSHVETIATASYPEGIGLDVVARKVYWASGGCVYRTGMAGGPIETFTCSATYKTDVAVDHARGHVYWTEADEAAETGTIRRAHLDGTLPETVVAAGLAYPWGLALTPTAALPSDFNGDGYADLATGVPGEGVHGKQRAGAVNVLQGSRTGLTAAGDQLWTQDSPGVLGGAKRDELFGRALASGDFDGDGYADLAVGSADRLADGTAGSVNVLYGTRGGLGAARDQRWTRVNAGESLAALVDFGAALVAADFDGDGYWDLAIGAPFSTMGAFGSEGAVMVLRGGPDGLTAVGGTVLTVLMSGAPDMYDYYFGMALAAGDLDGDGRADLAVGAPGAASNGYDAAGLVAVFHGSTGGISTSDTELWSQDSPGIAGGRAAWERFGASLAIGDFDADGYGDLAVGVPDERFATDEPSSYAGDDIGAVNIIYGSAAGLTSMGSQFWHQDAPGVPGVAAPGDEFGDTLTTGDFDGDGADDLAIGNPGERVGGVQAGAITVLYGGVDGLSATGARRWTQASPGVPGTAEPGDRFGDSLASADYGRSARDDLAIGVPSEGLGRRGDDGMVNVLFGSAAGLDEVRAQQWSQGSPGVLGTPEDADRFGSSLTP